MAPKPCIVCGLPSEGSRCADHEVPSKPPAKPAHARGYDRVWRRLSERARRMQPWCSDCGTTYDLTGDHSPEAWKRKARGLAIRLSDIDVVCRRCNADRGAARGENVRERPGEEPPSGPGATRRSQARTPSHTPGGYL